MPEASPAGTFPEDVPMAEASAPVEPVPDVSVFVLPVSVLPVPAPTEPVSVPVPVPVEPPPVSPPPVSPPVSPPEQGATTALGSETVVVMPLGFLRVSMTRRVEQASAAVTV
jgi:hypothetical protein